MISKISKRFLVDKIVLKHPAVRDIFVNVPYFFRVGCRVSLYQTGETEIDKITTSVVNLYKYVSCSKVRR